MAQTLHSLIKLKIKQVWSVKLNKKKVWHNNQFSGRFRKYSFQNLLLATVHFLDVGYFYTIPKYQWYLDIVLL